MDLDRFRNKLIVFEGVDKTGKTSVAKAMAEYLNSNGVETVFTYQPGDTNYGTLAPLFRSLCKDNRWQLHELTNFFIFFADKTEQVDKVVRPALQKGKTVISDRWWYSTFAYQFYGKRLIYKYNLEDIPQFVDVINKLSVLQYEPDITYYFPVVLDVQREKNQYDTFENVDIDFKKRVSEAYTFLEKKYKFERVFPGNTVEETLQSIIQ